MNSLTGNEKKIRREGGNDKTGRGKKVNENTNKSLRRDFTEIASCEPKTKKPNIHNTSRNGTSLSAQMTVSNGLKLLSLV